MATTAVPLQNWCDTQDQYRSAREAILAIDMDVQAGGDEQTLNACWTAIVVWLNANRGIIDPQWYPLIARFHRLSKDDLNRVREAIEMRLRAIERAAA